MSLTRRVMLAGTALSAMAPIVARAAGEQKLLRLQSRQIEVGGKAATAYGAVQPSGALGLSLDEGDDFDVRLENGLAVPSSLHWHGMVPPWRQDGVPFISAPPLPPGKTAEYKFPAWPTGTRWMHSHFGLQEQSLLAAPLIVREAEAIKSGVQEVVILLQDFSWTDPKELFEGLRPLPAKPVDRSVPVDLVGTMASYSWGMVINHLGGAPVTVKRGERVELVMRNTTMMAHPMHLHGHNFQVTEIGGMKIAGAVRDSVLVPPMATVRVVFDADNPGLWAYHCHNLYHMEAGMFATVVYEGFS
jgi:FtsP/CotA-like multicopper oxidase with cupredoxin domain